MGNEKMGLDAKSRALELILMIDLIVDDLRRIQNMFRSIECKKADDVKPDFNWYSLLKKTLEKQCNLILEKAEPMENEFIPN